jgi:monofunctional glycosyltransferase
MKWLRGLMMLVLSMLALQIYFLLTVVSMVFLNPQSTTFERSEWWRLKFDSLNWQHTWVDTEHLSNHLKKAVIASEDSGFVDHHGIEWDALEKAWNKNEKTQLRFEKMSTLKSSQKAQKSPKLIGGSTITQQLAKNLFLSSERHLARKGQELLITFMLEFVLSKERILEIYLNHVEWGAGVFGAQAAAGHYFHVDAEKLNKTAAAQLAVMLPAPKRFEQKMNSSALLNRAALIQTRMPEAEIP